MKEQLVTLAALALMVTGAVVSLQPTSALAFPMVDPVFGPAGALEGHDSRPPRSEAPSSYFTPSDNYDTQTLIWSPGELAVPRTNAQLHQLMQSQFGLCPLPILYFRR